MSLRKLLCALCHVQSSGRGLIRVRKLMLYFNKSLLWPITKDANSAMNQSEFEANTCKRNRRQAPSTIGFSFTLHWLGMWPKQGATMANQSKSAVINFNTQAETSLTVH